MIIHAFVIQYRIKEHPIPKWHLITGKGNILDNLVEQAKVKIIFNENNTVIKNSFEVIMTGEEEITITDFTNDQTPEPAKNNFNLIFTKYNK